MVTLTNAVREIFNNIFLQISAVRTGVRAYMDATPLNQWGRRFEDKTGSN